MHCPALGAEVLLRGLGAEELPGLAEALFRGLGAEGLPGWAEALFPGLGADGLFDQGAAELPH